jgi:Ca2+-binding RTX toxin-like protein
MTPVNGSNPGPIDNTVHGTSGDDNVHISKAPGLLGALGLFEVNVNGNVQYMTQQQLEHTKFELGAGNDTLVVDSNVKADITANGGAGNDVMIGGGGDDKLSGGNGDDIIFGRGGNDCINGGNGNDWLFGGRGDDKINGNNGNDKLYGGRGDDDLHGGRGSDDLHGGPGNDKLDGGRGHDHNDGGPGLDKIKFDWADLFHRL